MIRGTSLAILALLAVLGVVVLAAGVVSAAPRQQATDATLSSLTLSDVTLVPAFDPATTDYTATVAHTVAETTVMATPTHSGATVVISYQDGRSPTVSSDGTVPLNTDPSPNGIYVDVTAQDGTTTKEYVIEVTRPLPLVVRSISPSTVVPGGIVDVTLDFDPDRTALTGVDEYLPDGFSWVPDPAGYGPLITAGLNTNDSRKLEFTLLGKVSTVMYQVTASDMPGEYEITGTMLTGPMMTEPVEGDTQITVALPPGVTVSPEDLTVGEGGSGMYTVKLNTQPSAAVTVTINDPTDNTDVTASPASLSFSTTDWATAQTVTVSAAEDDDPSQDTATVTHTVSGGDYASITASAVTVTVTDNDTRGITVTPTSLTVDEGSSTDTYTVKLDTLPTGNVTVAITSNNTDVTASPSSLTFTTTTWNTAQTITVTAGPDADAADDMATLTHKPSGADYASVDNADLAVTVTDDDTAGVTVSPTSLTITEDSTNMYTVVLVTQPTASVTVTVNDPTDNMDVTVNPARLTFSTSNWATAQTVTVSAGPDDDTAADTATVTHTVSGGDYAGLTADDVGVTVTDNSVPGIAVSLSSLTADEGSTSTYTVELDTIPTASVTVGIASSSGADVTTSPSSLSFTATTWSTAQTVTVTAVDDKIDEDAETVDLTHSASGGGYGSVTAVTVAVTVNDDDTRGVTVSPTSLTVNEGGTGTYTVVLGTEPTSGVTVTVIDPTAPTDVTANPASLSFSTTDWATAQTVTVAAAEDGDASQDRATVTHTVVGGDYASFAASNVTVTVTDNDTPGVKVSPTSLTVAEGSSTGTYTVELNTQPSGEVMVAISTNNTDVTASSSSLTFTATTWNTAQTVTVTAGSDADAADDMATLTHKPSGADYGSVSNAGLTVTVTDDETAGVTVTSTSLTIIEGNTDTYTVKLDTEPTATVTIRIADDSAEVSVSPSSLTFTASTWSMAQTVTVASMADDVDEGTETAKVMHTVNGGDYTGLTAADVTVTVEDNDMRGVTVSESSLTIEEGDRGTYTVVLTSAPTANVMVGVSSETMGVNVSPSSLTFTAGNWASAKTVTVSTTEDRIDEADQTAAVTHMVSGGDYGSVSATGVTVTVTDDDTRGLTFSSNSLTVAESGTGTYTVKLGSQPTAAVTVSIDSDITDVSVNPATLMFTTSNWASPQTVTATAHQDDIDKDAGVTASLTHDADGGDYGPVDGAVSVMVTDNDTRGVTVSASSLTIREGENDTYTVALMSAPTDDVTIGVSPGNGVSVSSNSLTFTASTWSAAQTVTVSATDNDIDEANRTVSVTHSVNGGDYGTNSVTAAAVTVTVEDNDTRGVTVTPTSLMVNEGDSGMYTVVLTSEPTSGVTVTVVDPTAPTDVTADPASLSFSTTNWATEQTVTVSAAQDADALQDTATVTHTVVGGDYASFAASSVSVTVQDDDTPGVAVSPTALTIDEDSTGTYTVELNTQPSGNVTVAITSNNTDVTVSSSSLTFTTTTWNTAQTVTVTAGEDDDAADDMATLTHNPSGGGYNSVSNASLTVTVTDNDTAGVRIFPTLLPSIAEGSTGSYAVVLDTQPLSAVTVTPGSDNGDVRVNPARLRFTTTNWAMAQFVTVTARHDGDAANDTATVTHTVSGYGSVTTADSVAVTVTDDDTAGVTVSVQDLMIDEGRTGMYTVVLASEPTTAVTIEIESDNSDVTTNTNQLRFTTSSWPRAQTVTVTAGDDGDDMDDSATISHTVMGYVGVTTVDSVTVAVTDNDTPGVTVSPMTLRFDEGTSDTYTVVLNTLPTSSVTVTVSSDNAEVTAEPASLTFTQSDWNNPQAVTVGAERDGDDVSEPATISHGVSGYGSITTADSVDVNVTDLDRAGVAVSTMSLQISEGGMETYTLVLGTEPVGTVTVAIASTNPDVTTFPVNLTFTVTNWREPQTVTVSAAEDDDSLNDTSTVSHRVSGYGSVTTAASVMVTVTDNETPPPTTGGGSSSSGGGGGGAPQNRSAEFTDGSRTDRSVPENTPAGANIGEPVAATDREDDTLTYSLRGADAESFDIDPSSGQLLTKAAFDYETEESYSVIVAVSDGKSSSGGASNSNDDFITVTITVTNEDEDGTVALSSADPDVDVSITAALTDPDGGLDRVVWSWERSADQMAWTAIREAASVAYTPVAADKGSYLRATASYTDGHGPRKSAQAATAAPVPSNAAPEFTGVQDGGAIELSVAENTNAGEAVGAPVAAMDAEDDALTYALSGADTDLFVIDAGTGEIRVGAGTTLDYEADKNVYEVTVTVTDSLGLSATVAVTITVTNVGVGSPLGDAYDADGNEAIDRDDAVTAVVDYFADRITREEVIAVIQLYFAG